MAFKLKTSLVASTPCVEYIEGKQNEAFLYGEALTYSAGKLTKCAPTSKPDFISLSDIYCKEEKTLVPTMRIFDFHIFEAPVAGSVTSVAVGDVVTLDDDSTGVSTQTTNGVAEILSVEEDSVTVKF
jgi:hypothetical protein